jgi:hypothetical protein
MSDFEQPVEPMSRAEAILRKYGDITPMSRVEDLLKELVDESGGSSVTVTPVLSEGVRLATIGVDGTDYNIYAPEDVVGSIVSVTTEYNTGTLLATITVNDVEHYIYVPEEEKEILTGFATPSATLGTDGQIYVQYTGDQETEAETIWSGSEHWSYYQPQWKKIGDFNPLDYYRIGIYGSSNGFTVNNSNLVSAILELSEQGSYWNASRRFGIKIEDNSLYAIQTYGSGSSTLYSVNGTNLIADGVEQVYSKTDGTWFPFPDKGNVEDVYINGTSVLDENSIAQIKSYQEVTKAEYDALPSSKLTDDILYCITDGGATKPGEYFNPVIYSTTEREVGVWTDGKPLYQKTLYSATTVIGESTNFFDLSALDIDEMVDWHGNFIRDGKFYSVDMIEKPSSSSVNTYARCRYVPDTKQFAVNVAEFSSYPTSFGRLYVTIQYTKTTDTPGSGKYTTLGVPSVHYSTEEQVIGTWIDGKTLYQKTFEVATTTIGDWVAIINDTSIFIKEYEGKTCFANGNRINVDHFISARDYGTGLILNNGHLFQAIVYNTVNNMEKYIITLKYTKTTD